MILKEWFLDTDLPPVVILYSGGLDTYMILRGLLQRYKGRENLIHAMPIDYGQRNWRELCMAIKVCKKYGVTLYPDGLLRIPTVEGSGGSLATTESDVDLKSQRATNVANRNVIFIAYATAWAEVVGAKCVYYGAELEPRSGSVRPDSTFEVYNTLRSLCLVSVYDPVRLINPMQAPDIKATMIAETVANGDLTTADFAETYTCYANDWPPCGECRSCVKRARAFAKAGARDANFSDVEDPYWAVPSVTEK